MADTRANLLQGTLDLLILKSLGAVLLASGVPALRAVRVDPNEALRSE